MINNSPFHVPSTEQLKSQIQRSESGGQSGLLKAKETRAGGTADGEPAGARPSARRTAAAARLRRVGGVDTDVVGRFGLIEEGTFTCIGVSYDLVFSGWCFESELSCELQRVRMRAV